MCDCRKCRLARGLRTRTTKSEGPASGLPGQGQVAVQPQSHPLDSYFTIAGVRSVAETLPEMGTSQDRRDPVEWKIKGEISLPRLKTTMCGPREVALATVKCHAMRRGSTAQDTCLATLIALVARIAAFTSTLANVTPAWRAAPGSSPSWSSSRKLHHARAPLDQHTLQR